MLHRALHCWRRGKWDGSVGVQRFGNDVVHPLEEDGKGIVEVRRVSCGLGTLAGQYKVLGDRDVAEALIENVAPNAMVDDLEEGGLAVLHLGPTPVIGEAYAQKEGTEAANELVLLRSRVVGDLGSEEGDIGGVVQELHHGRAALGQPGAQEQEETHPALHLEVGALCKDVGALLEEGHLSFPLHRQLHTEQLQLLGRVEGIGEGNGGAPVGESVLAEETGTKDVTS